MLFISHSSKDTVIVTALVKLISAAIVLPAEEIRCTSLDEYQLPGGANIDKQLRHELKQSQAFIGLISDDSLESMYVVFELGARWSTGKHLIPLLAPGTKSDILQAPLSRLNALHCDNPAHLHQLVSELGKLLDHEVNPAFSYQNYVDKIVQLPSSAQLEAPISLPPYLYYAFFVVLGMFIFYFLGVPVLESSGSKQIFNLKEANEKLKEDNENLNKDKVKLKEANENLKSNLRQQKQEIFELKIALTQEVSIVPASLVGVLQGKEIIKPKEKLFRYSGISLRAKLVGFEPQICDINIGNEISKEPKWKVKFGEQTSNTEIVWLNEVFEICASVSGNRFDYFVLSDHKWRHKYILSIGIGQYGEQIEGDPSTGYTQFFKSMAWEVGKGVL